MFKTKPRRFHGITQIFTDFADSADSICAISVTCLRQAERGRQVQEISVKRFGSFEFGSLDIVSDFVLRISDFQLPRKLRRCHGLRLQPHLSRIEVMAQGLG